MNALKRALLISYTVVATALAHDVTFAQAQMNPNLRSAYIEEREEELREEITELYGKATEQNITDIVYENKTTQHHTHFARYKQPVLSGQLFNNGVAAIIGVTADAFTLMDNETDVLQTLIIKEAGLVDLINKVPSDLKKEDFFRPEFDGKLYFHFAESYTYAQLLKHFPEDGSEDFKKHCQDNYFATMVSTLFAAKEKDKFAQVLFNAAGSALPKEHHLKGDVFISYQNNTLTFFQNRGGQVYKAVLAQYQ